MLVQSHQFVLNSLSGAGDIKNFSMTKALQLPERHVFTRCVCVCDGSATRLDFGDGREEMTRTERGQKNKKTLQACSSRGLHLLCSKQGILRPL